MRWTFVVAVIGALGGAAASGCSRTGSGGAAAAASPTPSPPSSPAGPVNIATAAPQPLTAYPKGAANAHVYFWCSPGEAGFCEGAGVELVLHSGLRLEPRRPVEAWKEFEGFVIARGRLTVTGHGRRKLEATHARFVSEEADFIDTTIAEIENDAARWQGVPVHLTGTWSQGFEENSIDGAWVVSIRNLEGFPPALRAASRKPGGRTATPVEVWAIADTSRRSYGHLGRSRVGLDVGRALYRGTRTGGGKNAARTSYLTVASKPWGEVWVDGRRIAQETPLRLHELAPGAHQVRIWNPSLRLEVRTSVRTLAARETVVRADLRTGTAEVTPR